MYLKFEFEERKVGFTTYRGGPYRESRVVVQRFRIEQELVLEE